MFKILFLLFELNYAFTFGAMSHNQLQVYENVEYKDQIELFVEFDFEMVVNKYFFIHGKAGCNFFQKTFLYNYDPYSVNYLAEAGFRFPYIEIKYSRYCIHPIIVYIEDKPIDELPQIIHEGSWGSFSVTFTNYRKDE